MGRIGEDDHGDRRRVEAGSERPEYLHHAVDLGSGNVGRGLTCIDAGRSGKPGLGADRVQVTAQELAEGKDFTSLAEFVPRRA